MEKNSDSKFQMIENEGSQCPQDVSKTDACVNAHKSSDKNDATFTEKSHFLFLPGFLKKSEDQVIIVLMDENFPDKIADVKIIQRNGATCSPDKMPTQDMPTKSAMKIQEPAEMSQLPIYTRSEEDRFINSPVVKKLRAKADLLRANIKDEMKEAYNKMIQLSVLHSKIDAKRICEINDLDYKTEFEIALYLHENIMKSNLHRKSFDKISKMMIKTEYSRAAALKEEHCLEP